MDPMTNERMIELMGMNDAAAFGSVILDRLEWRSADSSRAWAAQGWFGDDYHKLWAKTEGAWHDGEYESRNELLWNRIFSRWWSVQAGVRYDTGVGPERTWAAVGVQGLAPQWFEVEATLYVGEQGRAAARIAAERDLLLTQRLIMQPRIEVSAYSKEDAANGIAAGISKTELGLRVRYEIRRELAPYVGLAWTHARGRNPDHVRGSGPDDSEMHAVIGLRAWF